MTEQKIEPDWQRSGFPYPNTKKFGRTYFEFAGVFHVEKWYAEDMKKAWEDEGFVCKFEEHDKGMITEDGFGDKLEEPEPDIVYVFWLRRKKPKLSYKL